MLSGIRLLNMDYTPLQLAEKRRSLALEYKKSMQELAELKKKRAFAIIKLLDEHKTISKAELYYNATEDGQKELELTYYTKGLLETMRAVKSEIEMKSAESWGQY